jgi:uncharacterized protein YceH (UPF0502 family)
MIQLARAMSVPLFVIVYKSSCHLVSENHRQLLSDSLSDQLSYDYDLQSSSSISCQLESEVAYLKQEVAKLEDRLDSC